MTPHDVRTTFVDFYCERGHRRLPSTSLVPPDPDDPVLLVTSGMHPLVPYLTGRRHPNGPRLVNSQRCLRTTDLDEVGDDSHLTLFEMLGSWSLGDYSHSQSLRWGYELVTDGFGMSPDRLGVTVYGGSDECPPDEGSVRVWRELGIPDHRISRLVSDNWWSGPNGLCGPDSEMFVWTGRGQPSGQPGVDDGWTELWNHVSMIYERDGSGTLHPLPHMNVDTGMGFERLVGMLEGVGSIWDTSRWHPWTSSLGHLWELDGVDLRVVCDHLRSGITLIGDGVRPGNVGRGYVLRRLLRRSLRTIRQGDVHGSLSELPPELIDDALGWFDLDSTGRQLVEQVLVDEEQRYFSTLRRGRQEVSRLRRQGELGEPEYSWLWETHGLPREVVDDVVSDLH